MGPITLAIGWLYWVGIQLASLVLTFVGWALIFVLGMLKLWYTRPSLIYPNRSILVWRGGWLTWLWGNEEDGIDGLRGGDAAQDWWAARTAGLPKWVQVWLWCAWRNSVNNLRFPTEWLGGPRFQFTLRGTLYGIGWNNSGFPTLERIQ